MFLLIKKIFLVIFLKKKLMNENNKGLYNSIITPVNKVNYTNLIRNQDALRE